MNSHCGIRGRAAGTTFLMAGRGRLRGVASSPSPPPHDRGSPLARNRMYGRSVKEGLVGCNQKHQPNWGEKTEESNHTVQATSLGMGPDRQRSELGLITGANPEPPTKGISVDIMTSLLTAPKQ